MKTKMKRGMSIIEVMVCIVSLLIAVLGASGYRYFATLDIHRSDREITAGRVASQLCESWKGIGGGASSYNPLNDPGLGLAIETDTNNLAPEEPPSFTLLNNGGYYQVVSNNRIYYVTMSYHITNGTNATDPNLETLNVIVSWPANENSSSLTMKSLSLAELLITH
jgi:hypothetical protein